MEMETDDPRSSAVNSLYYAAYAALSSASMTATAIHHGSSHVCGGRSAAAAAAAERAYQMQVTRVLDHSSVLRCRCNCCTAAAVRQLQTQQSC
ncbi:unnamed protein product [Sphagnum tenellum]